jgi:hypothetical protein
MPNDAQPATYRQSEIVDVGLLDVFAQIEALLRCGRETQRDALRVRGLPDPVTPAQRLAAGKSMRNHVTDMIDQCRALTDVLHELQNTVGELEQLLEDEATSP